MGNIEEGEIFKILNEKLFRKTKRSDFLIAFRKVGDVQR
jgi:hypothetical protein